MPRHPSRRPLNRANPAQLCAPHLPPNRATPARYDAMAHPENRATPARYRGLAHLRNWATPASAASSDECVFEGRAPVEDLAARARSSHPSRPGPDVPRVHALG